MPKKGNKQAPLESEEVSSKSKTISESNEEEYIETLSKKSAQKGKVPAKSKGKRAVPQDSHIPLKGPQRKNVNVTTPHTPLPINYEDDDTESGSAEESTEKAHSPEVEATPISREDPQLGISFASVPIVQRWGYLHIQVTFDIRLSQLPGGNI